MINILTFILELSTSKICKLFLFFFIFDISVYIFVKFLQISKLSKDGLECNNEKQNSQEQNYNGWYYGIAPYFRTILDLTVEDIQTQNPEKKIELEKYYKAECLTYNILLKRYSLHHFFPFINSVTIPWKDIEKIKSKIL